MIDYYLKSNNETSFWAMLTTAGIVEVTSVDGVSQKVVLNGNSLDVIGTIYEPTGNTLIDAESGSEYPEVAAIPGFHANLRGALADEQVVVINTMLIAAPTSPVRVWA